VGANDAYNFGPLNYFQRPSDRYTVATYARYDISDMARTYLEASFHDDHTVAQIAPSGLFGFDASGANSHPLRKPAADARLARCAGPDGPGQTADALIFRRNVEGGGRQDDIRHTSFRVVTGVKGDIGPISYDVFAQTGKVIYQETYKNDFSIARSARAMDVVTDPATGNAVCRTALDGTDPACVPYNIWRWVA
jgi:iron complex outermembrane receptor protein